MAKLPQRLVNVRVRDREALHGAEAVTAAVRAEDEALAGRGRVLVRPSGTEPLVRVMVEAPSDTEAQEVCDRLVALVQRELGRVSPSAPGSTRPCQATRRAAGIFDAMCGIVGYVGKRPVRELLLGGPERLEYRGYDSAGISVIADGRIEAVRAVGNLGALHAKLDGAAPARTATARTGGGGGAPPGRHDRHRPHALGDPRARQRGERPPPLRRRRSRARGRQRDRRELHRAEASGSTPSRAACSPPRPTPR